MVKFYSIHPILIIDDDIVKIAEKDPSVVMELQNVAKTAADKCLFTVVIVASDSNLIKNLMSSKILFNYIIFLTFNM